MIQCITLNDVTKLDVNNDKREDLYVSGVEKIKEGLIQSFTDNEEFDLSYFDTIYFERNASSYYTAPLKCRFR